MRLAHKVRDCGGKMHSVGRAGGSRAAEGAAAQATAPTLEL